MVYLFYGENTYAAKQQVNKIVSRYKTSTGSDFGLYRFGPASNPQEIASALVSQPMFSEASLVLLEHPSQNKELVTSLEKSLSSIPDSTVLLVYDPDIDKRTKWFKELDKSARTKEFKPKTEPQLAAWIMQVAKQKGLEVEESVVTLLIDKVGADQWQLETEVEKLSLIGSVSAETVNQMVLSNPKHTIFELLDAAAAGKTEAALGYYDDLKKQNVHELEVLTMLGWQLRNLLVVSCAGSRTVQEISKDHGINPFVARKSTSLARRISFQNLTRAYRRVAKADYEIKTGRAVDPDALVEYTIFQICNLSDS